MSAPIQLVTKPKVEDEVRESVLRALRQTLEQAEAGEIDTVIMILGHPDGEWSDRCTSTTKLSEAIGRIEITKQEWIAEYLRGRG